MVYSDVTTHYINSKTDSRLIRYDVIKIDNDTYRVKVIDDQQRGLSHPSLLVQIADFDITRADYNEKYGVGSRNMIRSEMPPTFESTIKNYIQYHRDDIS